MLKISITYILPLLSTYMYNVGITTFNLEDRSHSLKINLLGISQEGSTRRFISIELIVDEAHIMIIL